MSAATTSNHLRKLADSGLLVVEAHGRHRYYRLAGPDVGRLIEALQQLAPVTPIRSLREGTRAQALRRARTCYDHLAIDYQLSSEGQVFLTEFGVELPPRRPVVRYCVDWSEQRHHLAGGLGRGLLQRLLGLNFTFGIPPIQ